MGSKKKTPKNQTDTDPLVRRPVLSKLKANNVSQAQYIDALREGKLILSSGPAGTGKTFISTYIASEKLLSGEVRKIVITRPIVEAGEKLGFLPGTLEEKINPYLRPVIDALEDHLSPAYVQQLLAEGTIEVAPLAYMRGRTFNDCFVILDEGENTTKEQMKMFVTRFGYGSTFLINGDPTQSDLPKHLGEHGLEWLWRKLQPNADILKVEFSRKDIVRHPIIETILDQLDVPDKDI